MNARPIDAAEGYRFFLRFNGAAQLAEINEYLRGIGLRAVSNRMYQHYQRLRRHAYSAYVPINRLDIALAGDYAWSDDLRARYPEVAEVIPATITWDAATSSAVVEALGSATATVTSNRPPPVGASVVLQLAVSGITRLGTVIRLDPTTKRFHLAFDPYTSIPVASEDSRFHASVTIALPEDALSVVAVADFLLRFDRLLMRSAPEQSELVRIAHLSLNSPLDLLLVGGTALSASVVLVNRVLEARKTWYEGTKAKYESEGIHLDNEQKRRNAQLEADKALRDAVVAEARESIETPLLDEFVIHELPKGDPESIERSRLTRAIEAAIDLPVNLDIELTDPDEDSNQ